MRKLLNYLVAIVSLSFSGEAISAQSQSEPIHSHSENNGVSVDYYYYPDKNQTMVVTNSKCWSCGGLGVCSFCRGAGGIWMSFGYVPCAICGSTGVCPTCNGNGTYSRTSIFNGNTNYGSVVGSDGTSWSGYVPPNSSSVSGSSSGGSSSSSSSSSEYYEEIVYAPDYTGSAKKVWCEKCKAYMYPHSHIRRKY